MKNLLLLAFSLGAILLAVEVSLRVLRQFTPPDPPRPVRPQLYVPDDQVGYHLWPSTRTCFRYPARGGRITEVVSNSDGFRSSRELGEPDPRPRILVTGDSFTEGLGVEEGERYTEILEARTGWRVDNVGIVGWGVGQMVRAVDALAVKAKADVVVLGLYIDDLRRAHPLYHGLGYAGTVP